MIRGSLVGFTCEVVRYSVCLLGLVCFFVCFLRLVWFPGGQAFNSSFKNLKHAHARRSTRLLHDI